MNPPPPEICFQLRPVAGPRRKTENRSAPALRPWTVRPRPVRPDPPARTSPAAPRTSRPHRRRRPSVLRRGSAHTTHARTHTHARTRPTTRPARYSPGRNGPSNLARERAEERVRNSTAGRRRDAVTRCTSVVLSVGLARHYATAAATVAAARASRITSSRRYARARSSGARPEIDGSVPDRDRGSGRKVSEGGTDPPGSRSVSTYTIRTRTIERMSLRLGPQSRTGHAWRPSPRRANSSRGFFLLFYADLLPISTETVSVRASARTDSLGDPKRYGTTRPYPNPDERSGTKRIRSFSFRTARIACRVWFLSNAGSVAAVNVTRFLCCSVERCLILYDLKRDNNITTSSSLRDVGLKLYVKN